MNFFDVPEVSHTTIDGKKINIKDLRPVKTFSKTTKIQILPGETPSAMARRAYGEDMELEAWKIVEANIVQLIESKLDFNSIKYARVPL